MIKLGMSKGVTEVKVKRETGQGNIAWAGINFFFFFPFFPFFPFFLDRKKKDKGQGGGGRYDDSSESHHHNRRAIGGKEAITIDAF